MGALDDCPMSRQPPDQPPFNFICYETIAAMPSAVRSRVSRMGYRRAAGGQLRHVVSGFYPIICAIVLFRDDKPIGWAALYRVTPMPTVAMSVWVTRANRGHGYGKALVMECLSRWQARWNPVLFGVKMNRWRDEYLNGITGQDDARDSQPTDQHTQISPNASVM